MTWSFPTAILGEAFSVAPFIKGGGLWQKRRADLEAPSVGQAPSITVCVTQHLRPLRCESLISLDAADKDRDRVSEPESGPKVCLSVLHGTSEVWNDAFCTRACAAAMLKKKQVRPRAAYCLRCLGTGVEQGARL